MKKLLLLPPLAVLLLLTACSTPATVMDYRGQMVPAVNGMGMSCKTPFLLTQDCSGLMGPRRLIAVDGTRVKIAGTADGHGVLIMDSSTFTTSYTNVHTAVPKLVAQLKEAGINVVNETAVAVSAQGTIAGYYFDFDGDAYSVLSKLSVSE